MFETNTSNLTNWFEACLTNWFEALLRPILWQIDLKPCMSYTYLVIWKVFVFILKWFSYICISIDIQLYLYEILIWHAWWRVLWGAVEALGYLSLFGFWKRLRGRTLKGYWSDPTVLVSVKVEATDRRISDYLVWPKYDSYEWTYQRLKSWEVVYRARKARCLYKWDGVL